MIYLYSGTPGSGKSLHTARNIYYLLKRKRHVICNFDIRKDCVDNYDECFTYKDNIDLKPDFLMDYAKSYFEARSGKVKEGE